jgi:SAM-dependent methyltransferase
MLTVDFQKLDIQSGDRILDIGCGVGRHTCEAYRHHGINVTGVDLNFDDVSKTRFMLSEMDHKGEGGGGSWAALTGDITALPFIDHSFDFVICSEVLEHIQEDKAAIKEIIRVLKPEKMLAVSVPRFLPERICWAISERYRNEEGGHVRIYLQDRLIQLFESAGVKCQAVSFAHALHSPYWWLKCMVGLQNDRSRIVNTYKRFLEWDIIKSPPWVRLVENILNPFIAKSLVMYLRKGG